MRRRTKQPRWWRRRRRKTIGTRLHKVYFFLWDHMYDRLDMDSPDWMYTVLESGVERPGVWLLCKIYGHEPMPHVDALGRAEFDSCVWCRRRMPFTALRVPDDL